MIIANFINKQDALVTGLDQYDYGQVLRIRGLNLPTAVEIHFGLEETGGTTTTRIGVTKDGVTDVPIPDSMLENGDTSLDYTIYAFIYLTDDTSGKTVHRIKMQVKARSKPELLNKPEEKELFRQAIEAVNRSAKEAEGWAHGREDMPERATDNAKYYSEQASGSAEEIKGVEQNVKDMVATINGIEQQVQDAKEYAGQAKIAAENALLSEREAKKSEEASLQHRTGAETAENNAELAEQNAKKSEQAAEKAKQLVMEMGQEVLNNKNHVDEKVEAFNKVVTDASDAINTKKTESLSAIETAKTSAVEAVEEEGTTQAKKVTDEGTKQVGAVKTEAEKHLKTMEEAVNGIVADRKQIGQNKTDVTQLKEALTELDNTKADAIVGTASGTLLNIKDSAFAKIVKLKVDKSVDWLKITGKNLLNVQGEKTGTNINLMEFGVGRIKYTTQDDYGGGYVKYPKIYEAGEYIFSSKATSDGVTESNGIRLGFNKEVSVENNKLIYNNYYKMYFMQNYSNIIKITASEPFTMMISINLKSSVKGTMIEIFDIQLERGTVNTEYESYCEEQNVVSPITEDKLNALHTNYPTTIISNSKNTEMRLTYVADTKLYIDNLKKDTQTQLSEIRQALVNAKIAGGGIIQIKDSANLSIQNLRVFGKSEQNGVPLPDAPIPIMNVGNKGNIKIEVMGSNLCVGNLKAFFGGNESSKYIQIDNNSEMFFFKSKKGAIYTFSCTENFGRKNIGYTKEYPSDRVTIYNFSANVNNTFVAKQDGYCCLYVNYERNDLMSESFIVNAGSVTAPFEPYKEPQILILTTPNELLGIKVETGGNYIDKSGQRWVCDEINSTERIQRIGRIKSYNNEPINTKYMSSTGELSVGADVIYVLEKPIVTRLTEEEQINFAKIHTNYPTTTILCDENCDMELEYTVDTKSYVDQKIAEISGAVIAQRGV